MDFHDGSNSMIDEGIITPIGASPEGSLRGITFDSDSPSDAVKRVLHRHQRERRDKKYPHVKGKKTMTRKGMSHGVTSQNITDTDTGDLSLTKEDVKGIYAELQAISDKLREENHILQEREKKLRERENMLAVSQESLQTITDHQIKVKMAAIENRLKSELLQMDQALKEKTKENKRLKENFETIKQANDVLKKEVEVLKTQNAKLTKSSSSLQARLANLQRKVEYEQKVRDSETIKQQTETKFEMRDTAKSQKDLEDKEKQSAKMQKTPSSQGLQVYTGTLSTLLDWVCEAHLKQAVTELPTKPTESYSTPSFITDRAVKILPSLVDILRDNASSISCSLPCLQFVYWSLLHMDQLQNQTNMIMSTTTRRLGEEIYYPKGIKVSDVDKLIGPVTDKCREGVFIHSSNRHVRFLSALIILKTLSRADVLAHAFDVLKSELKNDQVKELFLFYQATGVITHFMKPIHKTFVSSAVDVLLQMSGDSPFQKGFLCSCSSEIWFRNAAMLLRTPLPDIKILERLSIILQKLSKIKSNKRFFEVYTIVAIIQEMLLDAGNDNAFLTLNLKSVLFNLNVLSK